MKTLILVRHGKSSWKNDLPDHERPLKKRAFNDAELVIHAFKLQKKYHPTVFSSSAVRALTTAKLFQEALKIPENKFSVTKELSFNLGISSKSFNKIVTNAGLTF